MERVVSGLEPVRGVRHGGVRERREGGVRGRVILHTKRTRGGVVGVFRARLAEERGEVPRAPPRERSVLGSRVASLAVRPRVDVVVVADLFALVSSRRAHGVEGEHAVLPREHRDRRGRGEPRARRVLVLRGGGLERGPEDVRGGVRRDREGRERVRGRVVPEHDAGARARRERDGESQGDDEEDAEREDAVARQRARRRRRAPRRGRGHLGRVLAHGDEGDALQRARAPERHRARRV